MTAQRRTKLDTRLWPALLPLGYALALSLYYALRYGSRLAEQDTGAFVSTTRAIVDSGTLTPPQGAYSHGFAYQAVAVAAAEVTGLDLATVMLSVLPFLTLATALAAFVAFRALLGDALLGGIAAVLLFIQPEFVFVAQRGNHEKMTHMLLLLAVFLLVVTLRRQPTISWMVGAIFGFYLLSWTLIATNSFFASSLTAGLALALAGGLALVWLSPRKLLDRQALERLLLTVLTTFALLFALVAYIYAPAAANFRTLQTLIDRLAVLFLGAEPVGSPYAGVAIGWISPWIYPALTLFNWTVLLVSGATWCWLALRFARGGVGRDERGLVMLWLFAAAFAFQVGLGAVVDLSGFLATNLQIRLFPLFMMFGIPLAVYAASMLHARIPDERRRWAASLTAGALVALFAVLGVLKATNDPLVSNKWMFHTAHEEAAAAWFDRSSAGLDLWFGFDERLQQMQHVRDLRDPERGNVYPVGGQRDSTRFVLVSDVIERRSVRLGTPAPTVSGQDRIYDNGAARIYRRIPETPYQP